MFLFSFEFCVIFKNNFFKENLRTTPSEQNSLEKYEHKKNEEQKNYKQLSREALKNTLLW